MNFEMSGKYIGCVVYAPKIVSKVPVARLWLLCKLHPGVNRGSVSTYTANQAQMKDHIDIKQETNDNTIAIKTTRTDNS